MSNIITRNHEFENKLNWVKQNKKTIEMRHEKDTNSTYIYRTPEIDMAFLSENWNFFKRVEMAVIEGTNIYDKRPIIYYKIDTAGWIKLKIESTYTYNETDQAYNPETFGEIETIETWEWDKEENTFFLYGVNEKETGDEVHFSEYVTSNDPLNDCVQYQ